MSTAAARKLPDPETLLADLEGLYRTMLTHAEAQEWDAVTRLEPRRNNLVRDLARAPAPGAEHRPALERIQGLNADLERQALAGRGKTLEAIGKLKQGHRMRSTYAQVART